MDIELPDAEEGTTPREPAALLFAVLLFAVMLVSFRALAGGWLPGDDALRHAAKAISGRPWSDVLVLRPEIHVDSHAGWHHLLGWIHEAGVATTHGVVVFEVVALATLVMGLPLALYRRPEAWILALVIWDVFDMALFARLFEGRPYLVTVAVVLAFCKLWPRLRERTARWLPLFAALTAISTWLHGAFYLLGLPVLALLLAREWRPALRLAGATAFGVVVGLLVMGSPVAYPVQTFHQLLWSFAAGVPPAALVTEFRPWDGSPMLLLVVGLLGVWRVARRGWRAQVIDNPVGWLAALGWVLGFWVGRYWLDWGLPALVIWIADELEAALDRPLSTLIPRRRVLVATLLAVVFVLAASADVRGRWSSSAGRRRYLPEVGSALESWRPEPGGIIYTVSMRLFYKSFYENPRAPWKYVIGFEPTWMPPADLAVYRNILLHGESADTLAPWVAKLRPIDRLAVVRTSPPEIPRIEWAQPYAGVWIGRLRGKAPEPSPSGPGDARRPG